MARITKDDKWWDRNEAVSLILEHHMAASRMGFLPMYASLHKIDSFERGLLDGSLPEIKLFSESVLPLFEAYENNDKFRIMNIVKKYSPLFEKKHIQENKHQVPAVLKKTNEAVNKLCETYSNNHDITFMEILNIVNKTGLFSIPNSYKPILSRTSEQQTLIDDSSIENPAIDESEINALDNFLKGNFLQIKGYTEYISEHSPFFTHQGVKGLEFSRVMAIIDDSEAKGFLFSYDKLFGIKDKTDTDLRNESEGKETGIDRTRRLFYVICSRAKESLAIVSYTSDTAKLKKSLINTGWFVENEIIEFNKESAND
jgi:DNA helicase-2/ATP-dependent DNA helicase PcrA